MPQPHLILGIETSCDETGVAVYHTARGILSNVLFSQIMLHKDRGGIIPEIASRSQLERIRSVVQTAIDEAHITLANIDAIAVTSKPGLPGSLLVGVSFAKAIALVHNKPIIGIDHLEGHAFSPLIEHEVPFPHLCITASGGHSSLSIITGLGTWQTIGTTKDDAAGEAFDKIARLLGMPYPGGPEIEQRARAVDFQDFFTYPRGKNDSFDWSFSGLKTAVLYDLVKKGAYSMSEKRLLTDDQQLKNQVSSSLLVCIADMFDQKIERALKQFPQLKAVTFAGGVACNKYIKHRLANRCTAYNIPFYAPSPKYCTDNGAMIAFVGGYKAQQKRYSDLSLDIF